MYRAIKASEEDYLQYPLASKLDECCRAYGYYIYDCTCSRNGTLFISISADDNDTYKPAIFYNGKSRLGQVGFTIQTSTFGALDPAEFEKFVQSYSDALDLVKELEDVIDEIGVVPGETVSFMFD